MVNAAGETDTEVWVYDEIGYWGVTAQDFARELQEIDSDTITLRLNSPGGEVYDGIAIMNALIDHKARVVVKVDALAASIASVIAMAGDEVIMGAHSEFMIHDASTIAMGNAAEIQEVVNTLKRVSANIAEVYAERAGGDAKDWRDLMLAETWFSAEEAVAAGLADKVAPKPQKRDAEEDVEDVRRPSMLAKWDLQGFKHQGRRAAGAPALDRVRAGGASKEAVPDVEDVDPEEDAVEDCDHVDYKEDCQACEKKKAEAQESDETEAEIEDIDFGDLRSLFSSALGAALVEVDAETEGIDAEIFHHAIKGVTDAAIPLPPKVEPIPTAPTPSFPADSVDPEPKPTGFADIFRAAVELAANDAPAVNITPELPTNDSNDSFVIDPADFYNSLREAINQ